jgi:endonuclease/exonuclease/phosphatase (EEP) superfamily protein YafD
MRALLLATAAGLLVLAVIVQQVVRAQTGPLPMASVFEVHLVTLAGILAILAIVASLGRRGSAAWARLASIAVLVVAIVLVGGELWSAPEDHVSDDALIVLSWNLEMDSKPPADAVAGIADLDADVVALQELTPEFGEAIDADPTLRSRYPYRILDPRPGPDGLGILSRLPLIERVGRPNGRMLQAGLLLPDGRTAEVLDVHPRRPLYRTVGPLPVALNARARDEDVAAIREAVDTLDDPASALVVGDLNGTSQEPGLASLRQGLVDAHEAAGVGPGFTWRPDAVEMLGIGVLRIDHVLSGAWLRPVDTHVDCSVVGDHCRLLVSLEATPND